MREALEAFLGTLERHTLAELVGGPRRPHLRALLALAPKGDTTDTRVREGT